MSLHKVKDLAMFTDSNNIALVTLPQQCWLDLHAKSIGFDIKKCVAHVAMSTDDNNIVLATLFSPMFHGFDHENNRI